MKGFKVRIYPTKEQEKLIWNYIGACRFIWNYMLELQINRKKNGEHCMSAFSMNYLLKPLKQQEEYSWLCNVPNTSLTLTCRDLNKAFTWFFKKKKRFPKFKSKKKSPDSYPVRCDQMHFESNTVKVEKLGYVKYKTDFDIQKGNKAKFYDARISYVNGKYMLSFARECENQALELTDETMGIDLGIKELAVVACGNQKLVFHNINKSKRIRNLNKRIAHAQKSVCRKYESSMKNYGKYVKTSNIVKAQAKVKRLLARRNGIKLNYLHQTTHKLIMMKPSRIIMESLNVEQMLKNKHLAPMINEQRFGTFIFQMKYKCEWNGIEFIQADKYFPSSKKCSCCGAVKRKLRLDERTYHCDSCGFETDRDYNAAINLMKYEA